MGRARPINPHFPALRSANRLFQWPSLHVAIRQEAGDWISGTKTEPWRSQPDEKIIGERYSPACYIAEAMPASLYLAWKYHDDFAAGVTANAMVGGDNCHRRAVVGSLLGAACDVTFLQASA